MASLEEREGVLLPEKHCTIHSFRPMSYLVVFSVEQLKTRSNVASKGDENASARDTVAGWPVLCGKTPTSPPSKLCLKSS